ncbi:TonB-dependent receptor [Ferruginibacter albus]|uniref:TonB-dependent receptor n=1 Tax=Ferruginibacter albus TaxID=2875540 RepID=UPI001CC4D7E4|nr:TonB-dependent receptor plug domain-containing protein [Ferruginibacter albus]UAY53283.1 TonB-dependent receptor [Ferruginibacter albus]
MKKLLLCALACASVMSSFAQQGKKFNDTTALLPVEVSAVKASDKAPFAKTNLSKKELAKNNLGQDLPFLLNQTPSVVVNSDAGNGVGYTGIHIRGTDATRINVTLNGIPYNDAESQGTYFVDIPDIASSAANIQIQRGVGTSSNGAGAFGGTINITTNDFIDSAYATAENSYGSFNTWKNTIKVGSGLINDHFTIDARLSKISSDGYIDRASSDFKSLYLSAAYVTKSSSLRFNLITGKEKTYQAWNGVPDYLIDSLRTYNELGTEKPGAPYSNQTDNYQQDHYQLFFNHTFNSKINFSTAAFMTYGRGYYEEYKAGQDYAKYGLPDVVVGDSIITTTDLVRQLWLDNHFYGQVASLQYKNKKDEIIVSGEWTRYEGKHYGNITWAQNGGVEPNYQYYNLPALKTDITAYVKWQHNFSAGLFTFADLQYRNVYHRIDGFDDDPSFKVSRNFNFVNPKAGITYIKNGWQTYFSYALGQHEPNRDDFFANPNEQPKAETLHDFELGTEKKGKNYFYGINLFYMLYKDQLVLTGKINDVGEYTRTNTPDSYRAGIELQGQYTFNKYLNIAANAAFSINKIKSFSEYLDEYDSTYTWTGQQEIKHTNTDISYSPSIVAAGTISITPTDNFEIALIGKYVGKQYLDNTSNENRMLKGYYTQDARVSYTLKNKLFKSITFIGQVNNLFSAKYLSNGYTYSEVDNGNIATYNWYFPMALINYRVGINFNL